MNYQKIYDALISRAKGRVYCRGYHERHHIVPRSLGGTNNADNIAVLTFREHFLAHWLLVKIHKNKEKQKMQYALHRMVIQTGKFNRNRHVTSGQYAIGRKAFVQAQTGKKATKETILKMKLKATGRKHTEESKSKMRGRRDSPETIEKRSKALRGRSPTEAQRAKMKQAATGRTGEACPRSKRVLCLDDNRIFCSGKEAALFYNISRTLVCAVCLGKRPKAKGYRFVYIV